MLIVILAAVVAGSAWLAREHRSELAEMDHDTATVSLLQDAKLNGAQAFALLELYLITGDETLVPAIRSQLATADESLASARAREEREGNEELSSGLGQVIARAAPALESFEQVIALRQSGDVQAATAALLGALPSLQEVQVEFDRLAEIEREEVAELRHRADRAGDLVFWLLVVSGIAGAALGLAASVFIARSILRPLSSLEAAARAVTGGDLEARAPASGPRELARLGASLNQMTDSLLDASKRRDLEEALRRSEESFRLLIENAFDIIMRVGAEGTVRYMSPSVEGTLGYKPEELIGKNPADLVHPDDLPAVMAAIADILPSLAPGPLLELRLQHRDGSWRTAEGIGRGFLDDSGAPGIVVNLRDITECKRAEEKLRLLNEELEAEQRKIEALNRSLERRVRERTKELRQRNRQLLDARAQAATDGLTGLPNHRAFHERVREEVRRAQATGRTVGLIMMDIDVFKRINDSLGHLAGDKMLRELAAALAHAVGRAAVHRYGGDEFAVLLPGADPRLTARTAERLRRAVERRVNGGGEKVTVSLGVASFPETAGSAEELVYGADAAMYWAKSAGKNRVGDWSQLVRRRSDGTEPWYLANRAVKAPDVIAGLVAALEAKDPATSAHTERCSWYAARLAEELGLGEEDTSIVRLAALLHDIGKLAVPDEVLFKPGPLNEDEWAQMKQHPTTALRILGQIRAIADATPAILHHHEHFDGSGYPDGLGGEEIPIASRILLVGDAFDAMTTDRPYRKAMSVEAAIEELQRNSGSQFDPEVVAAFLRILARHGAQPLCGTAPDQADTVGAAARRRRSGRSALSP